MATCDEDGRSPTADSLDPKNASSLNVGIAYAREGIENSYYLAEFKAIFEGSKKVTLNLTRKWRGCWWTSPDTQSAPLLGLCAYPDLSFSSAYNDSSTMRSSN
jgi:hypothetical protein